MRRPMAHVALVATTVGLAANTGGCGGDDEPGIRDALTAVRQSYLTEDYRGACEHLSAHAQNMVGGIAHGNPTTCPRDLAERLSSTRLSGRDRAPMEVRDISVDGSRASALLEVAGGTPTRMRLVKEDGRWKLDQVFGTTAPPPPGL